MAMAAVLGWSGARSLAAEGKDDLLSDDAPAARPAVSGPASKPSAPAADDLLDDAPAKKPTAPATTPKTPAAAGDDLLDDAGPKGAAPKTAPASPAGPTPPTPAASTLPVKEDPHAMLMRQQYPSAAQCAKCHGRIYDEWASSSHAYASISPMFHKFEQKINNLSQGTVGYFCMRCHGNVGTTLKETRDMPLWERSPVSAEGVTCITCHRVKTEYNKSNGQRRIEPGDIHDPVYGNTSGTDVQKVVTHPDEWHVKPAADPKGPGMDIHREGIQFEQLSRSDYCVSCHQVAVYPGIKLEVVWDQYRASPAAAKGVTCQQCHMGTKPGIDSGYAQLPVAVVNGKATPDKPHHNHAFFGPGYPTAHPGLFPQNPRNTEFPAGTWLKFDYRAGWGRDEFEDKVAKNKLKIAFPKEWDNVDDRQTARDIITENQKRIEAKRELRRQVMENGSHIDGPFFQSPPAVGRALDFHYVVKNTNPGHNLPSGSLGAQPEIWLNAALVAPDGKTVWESGYVDGNGDMADIHSEDVGKGKIKFDDQLFNLQTKFLTTNVKGTDREMFLPINVDIDQLPFIRPAGLPISVLNHPPFIRMEAKSIPPLGSRNAAYRVPAGAMKLPGTYKLAVRLRSRAEPIYFMRFCNATRDMEQSMNEWMIDLHPYTVQFEVK
ncbi:MAG: cytochrome [Phycisphaerales bacterium]|nr:cytochrome [Phycisphaerales bacterium]